MQLPAPDELRTMRGRNVLALAFEWFEAEGRLAVSSAEAVAREYGVAAVGDEMRVRASMSFAVAAFIQGVLASAQAPGGRKQDGVLASHLANALRSGFLPSSPEVPKNAA
jgi:hypothetical protein